MEADDRNLLREYIERRSEDAFATLVSRHVNLVYSVALRTVRSPHLAEEVAQSVFTDLARNAGKLKPDTILAAWLYRVAYRTAIDIVRSESRRQLREQKAMEAAAMNSASSDWSLVEPLLDEGMETLDDTDRSAILLRYFENKSLREVGDTLGVSEDAAQKRVSRAVERLRESFSKRGITVGASGLVVVISANAIQAAPAGLAATISSAAVVAGTAIATTTTATKVITMTTLHKALIAAVVVAGVATPLVIQHRAQVELRSENESLQRQVNKEASENKRLSDQLAQATGVQSPASEQGNDLQKLRDEVQALRKRSQDETPAKNSQPKSDASFTPVLAAPTVALSPADSWAKAGTTTPKDALQTLYWAMAQHDSKTFGDTLAWEPSAEAKAEALFAAAPKTVQERFVNVDGVVYALFSGVSPISGFAVVSENIEGNDGTVIEQHQYTDGRVRQNQVTMHHFDDGWRIMLVGDEKLLRGFDAVLKRAASANGNP